MAELPAALRQQLPPAAQRVYRQAYREARDAGADEDGARLTAQEAVEEAFHREGTAWVPRSNEEASSGPPYGEARIAMLARDATFPCTGGQLADQLGNPVIEIAEGQPMALRDVLDIADGGYWPSANALLEAIHASWPAVKRRWDEAHLAAESRANL
jgi:cation transport regulator ChaB